MRHFEIILETGTFEGPVTMRSINSQFRATRCSRAALADYAVDLNYPGIYMLLIGTDTVYVGQTAMNLFQSQTCAGQFFNGTSFDGNGNWKTKDGVPLKQFLE